MDDVTSSLLVFMHASITVQDEEVVSSIPFRGEFDFLEATVELGKLFTSANSIHHCCQPVFL